MIYACIMLDMLDIGGHSGGHGGNCNSKAPKLNHLRESVNHLQAWLPRKNRVGAESTVGWVALEPILKPSSLQLIQCLNASGWCLTYPSEKYESSSIGMTTFPIYGKIKTCSRPPTSG